MHNKNLQHNNYLYFYKSLFPRKMNRFNKKLTISLPEDPIYSHEN